MNEKIKELTTQVAIDAVKQEIDLLQTERDELLEELVRCYEDINYYGNSDFNQSLIRIDSVIRKAKGELE